MKISELLEKDTLSLSVELFPSKGKEPFVLATVEGDIRDAGKTIVELLLENMVFVSLSWEKMFHSKSALW